MEKCIIHDTFFIDLGHILSKIMKHKGNFIDILKNSLKEIIKM